LVVAESEVPADLLVAIVEPLARSHAPHELLVAELVDVTTRTDEVEDALSEAVGRLDQLRVVLTERGVSTRVAAFTSGAKGDDVVRLAAEQGVDLVLLGRYRRQLAAETLDPDLHRAFAHALCDVAVYVPGDADGEEESIVVPFAGSEHDWAALELAAWIAMAKGSKLRLLGVTSDPETGRRDASRLLAAASLAVQQLVNVATEPRLLPAGREALIRASQDASLAVAGVPTNWRERGLGHVRAAVVANRRSSTLLVRRGVRPGGLAPEASLTRFTWSLAEIHEGSPNGPA
jgi:hypothetical protein